MIGRQAIAIGILLFVSGTALAQEPDPAVNDSDYDTTVPTSDEAYLDEGNATASDNTSDPTVSDADFDTTVPTNDEAYLDESTPTDASATDGAKGTPGLGFVGIVAGVAVLAIAVRRR